MALVDGDEKEAVGEKRPIFVDYVLALLMLLLGGAAIYWLLRTETVFGWVLLGLFFGAQLVAVIMDVVNGEINTVKVFVLFYIIYCLQTLASLLGLVMAVPLLALNFLAGPAAFFGFAVAGVGLVIYLIEEVMVIDIGGVSFPGGATEAGWLGLIFVVSVLIFLLRFVVLERLNFEDNVFDVIGGGLRPLAEWQEKLRDM